MTAISEKNSRSLHYALRAPVGMTILLVVGAVHPNNGLRDCGSFG
jgi:hypothetical protein